MHVLRERREDLLQAGLRQVRPRGAARGDCRAHSPALSALPAPRRLFGIKCAKCQVGFSSSDLVMRARDSVYHIECFRCSVCSRQLLPGDEFSLREHELLCRADHGLLLERAAAGSPHSPGPLPTRGLHLSGEPRPRGPVCGVALAPKLSLLCVSVGAEPRWWGHGRVCCVRGSRLWVPASWDGASVRAAGAFEENASSVVSMWDAVLGRGNDDTEPAWGGRDTAPS